MAEFRGLRAVPDPPELAEPIPLPWAETAPSALGEEIAALREAVFAVGETSRRVLGRDRADVHVALAAAAHQLGEVERLLAG